MSYTFLWYATRGAGAVSMVLLSGVVILGILSALRVQATGWPRFLTTGLHRNVALTAVVFLALHIVTAVVDPYTHLGFGAALVPFSSYYRTFWLGLGAVALELMVAIVITSLVRGFVGHRAWRLIHWLAYACWPVAIIHGFGTGTDVWSVWFLALAAICIGAVGVATVVRLTTQPVDPLAGAKVAFRSSVDRRQLP